MESECSSHDIPIDLLIEILIRLPVKSLVRFTCVCKSWLRIIRRDREFAIRHYLSRSRSMTTTTSSCFLMDNVDYVCLYFNGRRRKFFLVDDDQVLNMCIFKLTERKTFRVVRKLEIGPGLNAYASNFCHGIMCISVWNRLNQQTMLCCNPAIWEVVQVPLSVNIAKYEVRCFGIGFDCTTDDYKILAIMNSYGDVVVDVYSLRGGCWHSLSEASLGSINRSSRFIDKPVLNAKDRILNLMDYSQGLESSQYRLLSFDMVDEVFREISMPGCRHSQPHSHDLVPSSRWRASICCSPSRSSDHGQFNCIDIWVLNDDHEWNKQISVTVSNQAIARPMNVWMNDSELFVNLEGEAGVPEVFLYNICSGELKRTGRHGTLGEPCGYMESLVSLKGLAQSSNCENQLQDHGSPKEKHNDSEAVYFIRDVRRKDLVRWCFNFNLS